MYHYLWYFMLYAVVGWSAEVIFIACTQKKFVNRGFLSGPYLFMGSASYWRLWSFLPTAIHFRFYFWARLFSLQP